MNVLRLLFFVLIVRPVLWIVLGFNVRNRERLPMEGPALIVANHNSHLDTLSLMSLLPLRLLPRIRPAAAADYFLRNRYLAWFALNIIGIIPIERGSGKPAEAVLAGVTTALDRGDIVILFPEGTRGEPECLGSFRKGIAILCGLRPQVPVYPVFLHGLGKALPSGSFLLVPFFCDVFVGEALAWSGDELGFMQMLDERFRGLMAAEQYALWE